MKPDGPIKLVSQLLDLPMIDRDGCYCGIVDDIELERRGRQGGQAEGAAGRSGRLRRAGCPRWMMALVRDDRRRPGHPRPGRGGRVDHQRGSSQESGASLGLHKSEKAAAAWIPKGGAM